MSHDMPADSVHSMHIRIRFGLNAHSIRFAENCVICEMLQCAFKTELGCNVKRPLATVVSNADKRLEEEKANYSTN